MTAMSATVRAVSCSAQCAAVRLIASSADGGNNAAAIRADTTGENTMSWVLGGGAHSFGDLMALRPNLAADLAAFSEQLWHAPGIDPVTLELCRLRVAQLHGARAAFAERRPQAAAAGLTGERIARLADYGSDPGFSACERACLELAELFAMDPSAIDDATFAAVRDALGEPGTVALLEALAVFDGFSRAQVMLDAAPATETRA